jgi:hypothetical protein
MRSIAGIALALFVAACSDSPDVGDSCSSDAQCPSGTDCHGVGDSGLRLCLAPCEPALTVRCTEEGQGSVGVCLALEDAGACYPGGGVRVGEACQTTADCELNALCVLEAGEGRCRIACDVSAPDCPSAQTCASLDAGIRGYCASTL